MPLFPPQDYRKTFYTHRRGTRAEQPLAGDVLPGTLYYVTDEAVTEWSDGANWQTYTDGVSGVTAPINISAGTTSNDLTNLVFSNSNNVSFGLNGSTITGSASFSVNSTQASIRISAGTTSILSSAFTFSNSNGVSFGIDNGTITASVSPGGGGITNINISAGTTSNNLSNLVFSNDNSISFGLDGSTITASFSTNTFQGSINFSAGTQSSLLSAITFSNSNGISFGLDAGTVTASHNGLTSQSSQALSAANGSFTFQTAQFINSNGISWSTTDNSGIIASHNGLTSQSNQVVSADNGSFAFQTLSFSNANNVSFITSAGSAIAASIATSLTNIRISAGTTSNLLSVVTFSNSNGVTFGLDNGTITASINPAGGGITAINVSAGTTSNNLTNFILSNSNNISFGLNGSTITATATVQSTQGSINISAGTTSNLSSNFIFSNSNNVSFGLNGNTVTASVQAGGGATINYFLNQPYLNNVGLFSQGESVSAIQIAPLILPQFISADQIWFHMNMVFQGLTFGATSTNTTWTGQQFRTYMINIFTRGNNASSFSLFNSLTLSNALTLEFVAQAAAVGSQQSYTYNFTYPVGSTTSTFSHTYAISSASWVVNTTGFSLYSGSRFWTLPFTNLTPGNYWVGLADSITSTNIGGPAGFQSILRHSLIGIGQTNINFRPLNSTVGTGPMYQLGAGNFGTTSQFLSTSEIDIVQIWNVNSSNDNHRIMPFHIVGS